MRETADVQVSECTETVLVAGDPDEARRWVCYRSRLDQEARRWMFDRRSFAGAGEVSFLHPVDEAQRFAVRIPGRPGFTSDVPAGSTPWATRRIPVQPFVGAPIRGRVTDAGGRPVGGLTIQITSLLSESWGGGDFAIVGDEQVRAAGGFAGLVRVDGQGCFSFDECGARGGQPFVVRIDDWQHRIVSPVRPSWTGAGGTWIDVVVE